MLRMTKEQFIEQLIDAIPEGTVFDNPGGGTSTIIKVGDDKLSYLRGKSRIYLPYSAMFEAVSMYWGKTMTSSDLKQHQPEVFDSLHNGHSCNCTSLFMILEQMGLIDGGIQGEGRSGSPYFVVVR